MVRGNATPLFVPTLISSVALLWVVRYRSARAMAFWRTLACTTGLTSLTILAGGVGTAAMSSLAIVPIIAVFLGGSRTGLYWTFVASFIVITFKLAEVFAWPWPVEVDPNRSLPTIATCLMCFGTFALCRSYEVSRNLSQRAQVRLTRELRSLLRALPDTVLHVDSSGICQAVYPGTDEAHLTSLETPGRRRPSV